MKKSLLLILASLFAVFSLTACADEDKNDTAGEVNGGTPVVNPASEYVGTYDVTFFATKPYDSNNHAMDMLVTTGNMSTDCTMADTYPYKTRLVSLGNMSTDCTMADTLGILKKVDGQANVQDGECAADGSNDAKIIGKQAVINYNDDGLVLETKLQMWSSVFSLSQDDVYQYTKYTAVPSSSVTSNAINNVANPVLGVSGRNLTTKTLNPKSTFKITKRDDGTLYVELELMEKSVLNGQLKANAPTYVILKKKLDKPEPVDPNTLFTTTSGNDTADGIYAKFKPTPDEAAQ